MITKDHLKQVLGGQQKFLKMKEVSFINAPAFDEIGVKNLYARIIQIEGMADYFPDRFPKGRFCDREYMYNVWNTLYPDDVKAGIDHANS